MPRRLVTHPAVARLSKLLAKETQTPVERRIEAYVTGDRVHLRVPPERMLLVFRAIHPRTNVPHLFVETKGPTGPGYRPVPAGTKGKYDFIISRVPLPPGFPHNNQFVDDLRAASKASSTPFLKEWSGFVDDMAS